MIPYRQALLYLALLALLPSMAMGGAGFLTASVFLNALIDAETRVRAEQAGRRLASGGDPRLVADRTGAVLVHRTSGETIVPTHWEDRVEQGMPDAATLFAQVPAGGADGGTFEMVAPRMTVPVGWTTLEDSSWTAMVPLDRAAAAGPVERLGTQVAVAVLVIVGGGIVVFILLLWPSHQMIRDLTQAADQVKGGDIAPWFPPPVDGDVGRLSFATNEMVQSMGTRLKETAQGARMAAVGELSVYLAHEIRNPLSSIRLNLQSLDREIRAGRLPRDHPEMLTLCLEEIGRLDNVASSVLDMARTPADVCREELHLHPILRRAVDVIRPQLERRGIEPILKLSASNDRIVGDADKLRGVFLAILMNGAEAMPEGGRIQVATELVSEKGQNEKFLRIRFTDEGLGVPPAIRERLFDPFFTTKAQGSGVGLPLALQMVKALGGQLFLNPRSELLPGAEFFLELPIMEPAVSKLSAPTE